ncbi:MAG TPA: sulfite exporter TauE/SafE family protein, partial [Paraburkholderia sp.]|uniref:sulfite exporter TauE/SafE family protein n=1 Tax=Paraburkholderia sp. TaxID=1926495 RepID=UPI002ED11E21
GAHRRRAPSQGRTLALTMLTGAVLGVLVSLTSVGAGAIGVTVLLLLYPMLPTTRIVGSDIAHAVPLTLLAGAGHWLLGSVDWSMLLSLLIGSLPGIVAGSLLSSRAPDSLLRNLLAATLTLVGARLVLA